MKNIFFLIVVLTFSACKSDNKPSKAIDNALVAAEKAYAQNKDLASATAYIEQLSTQISENVQDKKAVIALSEKAYIVAKDNNISSNQRRFLFTLLKEDFQNKNSVSRILELANEMSTVKRAGTANILYKALIENSPNTPEAKEAAGKLDPGVSDLSTYIINIGEEIFKGEVDKFGINRNAALKYVDACEAYALVYPNKEDAPSYLFRAAEIAKSIQTYPKLMSLYDWIIERYPNYEKTPTTYFLKGFVLENDLQNDDKAKEVYNDFIAKFPKHELRDDVDFLLEHIGKSDEEIRAIIESKQQGK